MPKYEITIFDYCNDDIKNTEIAKYSFEADCDPIAANKADEWIHSRGGLMEEHRAGLYRRHNPEYRCPIAERTRASDWDKLSRWSPPIKPIIDQPDLFAMSGRRS